MMSSTKKVSVWMCSCSEVGLRLVSDGAAPGQHRHTERYRQSEVRSVSC